MKKCKNCNKEIKDSSKFCSRECANKYNGIHIFKGRKNTWGHKTSKTIQKMYNSGKIFGWKKVNIEKRHVRKGSECYQWKGGVSFEYGKNWKKQRSEAWKRDNHTCQLCEKTKDDLGRNPDVHHIIPFELFLDKYKDIEKASVFANLLDNLITLCHSCHTRITNKILKVYKIYWVTPREDQRNLKPVETIRWTPKLGEDIVRTTKQFVDVDRNVLQLLKN